MTDHLINQKEIMPRTKEQFEEIRSNTKHKILESALILFADKGFKGTSISDIAKSAGISKGLAYNYFKDKKEIMISVFTLLAEEIGSIYENVEKESEPKKQLKALINSTFNAIVEDEKFWRIYMNFALSPEVKEEANEFMSSFMNQLFVDIEQLFRDLNYPNPTMESKFFAASLDGVCFHYIYNKQQYPMDKMRKFLIKKYCI